MALEYWESILDIRLKVRKSRKKNPKLINVGPRVYAKLACQVLHGHFGPVYLLQVIKNDDEEHCFLKLFGFIRE